MPMLAAEILRVPLGAFEHRRLPRRAEVRDAGLGQRIRQSGNERAFRTHDHECDILFTAECDDRAVIGGIKRHASCHLRDTGIAGRTIKSGQQRTFRQLPGQRVLAATGADQENIHVGQVLRLSFRVKGLIVPVNACPITRRT